mgnify:CR=1 FL=1
MPLSLNFYTVRVDRMMKRFPRPCSRLIPLFPVCVFLLSLAFALPVSSDTPAAQHNSDIGWTLNESPIPWKLRGAFETAKLEILSSPYRARFSSKSSGGLWTLTVEPIWIDSFPICRFSYSAQGTWNDDTPILFLRSGATGPVTPGAKNPENPLAVRGEATLLTGKDILPDGERHEISFDLSLVLDTHQVDQICVQLPTGSNRTFALHTLQFENPNTSRISSTVTVQETESSSPVIDWESIPIQDGTLSRETFDRIFDWPFPTSRDSFLRVGHYHFPSSDCAEKIPVTSLQNPGTIEIPLSGKACEIAFLLGCRLYGTDSAWQFVPRSEIHQPERLLARIEYTDGSTSSAFPQNATSQEFVVSEGLYMYRIPADPENELRCLRISEEMSYGQIFLPWISVNRDTSPSVIAIIPIQADLRITPAEDSRTAAVVQDEFLQLRLPLYGPLILVDLIRQESGNSLIQFAVDRRIFTIYDGTTEIPSSEFLVSNGTDRNNPDSNTMILHAETKTFSVVLACSAETDTGITMRFEIENKSNRNREIKVVFPDLRGLRISESLNENYYCFPGRSSLMSMQPVNIEQDYGGRFPLQFIDMYSPRKGGFCVFTQDRELNEKTYGLIKDQYGIHLSVKYGKSVPITLKPNEPWAAPPTVFYGHSGDWHDALKAYSDWARSWRVPPPQSRDWMRDVWICRRDYPLGGTGYLFDETRNQYTFSDLIEEGQECFGGIDLIDISGWAYSEQHGRVGDYDCSELGGAENLRSEIATAHRQGVRTGLYLEGYLVDERSRLAQQVGNRWQIVRADGQPAFWPGNREMFFCPAVSQWQDRFAQTYQRVAKETEADALYVDEFGFADRSKACYSDRHGHPPGQSPLIGEEAMLRAIRQALDRSHPETAIYTEEVPCDVTSQWVDAAFCYGMHYSGENTHPTKINLARYAFPELKIIELFVPGIHPRASSEEDAKLAFFHGHAVWLKGRAASWYSATFREFVQRSHNVRKKYSGIFASDDCIPLVPTRADNVYSNRFCDGSRIIYTLYNAGYSSVSGPLIAVPVGENQEIVDLWNATRPRVTVDGEMAVIHGSLEPHGIGCFLVTSNTP